MLYYSSRYRIINPKELFNLTVVDLPKAAAADPEKTHAAKIKGFRLFVSGKIHSIAENMRDFGIDETVRLNADQHAFLSYLANHKVLTEKDIKNIQAEHDAALYAYYKRFAEEYNADPENVKISGRITAERMIDDPYSYEKFKDETGKYLLGLSKAVHSEAFAKSFANLTSDAEGIYRLGDKSPEIAAAKAAIDAYGNLPFEAKYPLENFPVEKRIPLVNSAMTILKNLATPGEGPMRADYLVKSTDLVEAFGTPEDLAQLAKLQKPFVDLLFDASHYPSQFHQNHYDRAQEVVLSHAIKTYPTLGAEDQTALLSSLSRAIESCFR